MIFCEGNPARFHCVSSGAVKLHKTGRSGDKIAIRLLGRGKVVGYGALLAREPYAATAETVEKTVVCTIPGGVFEETIRSDVETAYRVISLLATELRVSEDLLVTRTQLKVAQRVARFFIWVTENLEKALKERNHIPLPLLREEIAQMVGTTPEMLSRVLRDLSNRRIPKIDRKAIVVVNSRALHRLAGS